MFYRFSKLILALALSALSLPAQTGTLFGFDVDTVTKFDAAYRASRRPEVAAIRSIPIAPTPGDPTGLMPRIQAAKKVAALGFIVDADLDVFEWDPYWIMYQRSVVCNLSWIPSAAQSGSGGSGPVPPGSVTVPDMSQPLDKLLALYPPFNPPAPPAPPDKDPIGPPINFQWTYTVNGQTLQLDGYYPADPKQSYPEGFQISDPPKGNFVFHYLGTSLMDTSTRVRIWLRLPQ